LWAQDETKIPLMMETKNIPPFWRSKRLILAIFSLLLAALLLFLFLPRNAGPHRAIPGQTTLLLECSGLLRAQMAVEKKATGAWKAVLHSPLFTTCFADAKSALDLFKHEPSILQAMAQQKALIAYTLHPSDSLHALFIVSLHKSINLDKVLKNNPLSAKKFLHQFHGNDIYTVHLSKTARLEVAISGNLLLFSRRATLVEDALGQLENPHHWWTDRPYLDAFPDAVLTLHLRPSALAEQVRGQMLPSGRAIPDLVSRNIVWAGLSWDGTQVVSKIETSGFWGEMAHWSAPTDARLWKILPDNTHFLARAGLRNPLLFFDLLAPTRTQDFNQYLLPWVGDEAAFVVGQPLSPDLSGDRMLIFSVRDSLKAVQSLRAYSRERGAAPGVSGAYQMFDLWGFSQSALLAPLLGDDAGFRNPVCTLVDGYVVFAPDRSSLEIFLDKYLVNQTLAYHIDFLQLIEKTDPNAPVSCWLNAAYLPNLLSRLSTLSPDASLTQTGWIQAGITPKSGHQATVSWASQVISQPVPETDVLWKTSLQATIISPPQWIAQADGNPQIWAQDIRNTLYCLDASNGAIRWTRALHDPILSAISGIRYYGSQVTYCAFNTAERLFLLDEQGKDVPGFPLSLPAPASNGICVVDFDGSEQFHYFVGCENGKMYGFDPLGKPLEGWNGRPIKGPARQPMIHFQHKGKDYLALLTETGNLYVWGRDGTLRFDPVAFSGTFNGPLASDAASAIPRLYAANTQGEMFACSLSGVFQKQTTGKNPALAAFGSFQGDARCEWAVLSGRTLRAGQWTDRGVKSLFSTQLNDNYQDIFFSENQIGLVNRLGRRVSLVQASGKLAPGFPLGGHTAFVQGRLQEVRMLVVGNGMGVWAYRVR